MTIEEAYGKWAADLVRYATVLVGPHEAADIVADAFTRLLEIGDARWRAVRDHRAFLFSVVLNAARSSHRGTSRRLRREVAYPPSYVTAELLADPGIISALGALSIRQRAVIFLAYWEDLSSRDIAEVLSISEGATKRHLARARASLRKVLQ